MIPVVGPALEDALRGVVRGFRVVERDLTLPVGDVERHVDLVGHDAQGRLVLVLVADLVDDAAVLRVVLASSFARESCAHAARPWLDARLDPARSPLVVLVAGGVAEGRLACLALLPAGSVAVLSARAADGILLAPLKLPHIHGPRGPADLVADWPEDARARGLELLRRVARVDPEIVVRVDAEELRWEWNESELGALACRGGDLRLEECARGETVVLHDDADVDTWLEGFVLAHTTRLAAANRSPRPLDLLARGAGPLLTDEEIAAFRD